MAIIGKLSDNKSSLIGGFNDTQNSLTVTSLSHVQSQRLSELIDVDTSARVDGSIIMWDEPSQTYKIRPDIDHPNLSVVGGSF
jgi:hypothetical protein